MKISSPNFSLKVICREVKICVLFLGFPVILLVGFILFILYIPTLGWGYHLWKKTVIKLYKDFPVEEFM